MKGYIEERAVELANYIIERKTTVRAAAKKYGISKSTVQTVGAKWNGMLILLPGSAARLKVTPMRFQSGSFCGIGGRLL